MENKTIDISQYDYPLPAERIAKFPLQERDDSKLLVFDQQSISHLQFKDIHTLLKQDDKLVFNNTKVVPARLFFKKKTGSTIEIMCLEPHLPDNYVQSFEQREKVIWKCMVGNLKRWKEECLTISIEQLTLNARIIERNQETLLIEFSWNGGINFADVLQIAGHIPIPPYLSREENTSDRERYQTIYSNPEGSVAAPTAGLHFTQSTLNTLIAKGVSIEYLTLHVGAGTFLPVKTNNAREHNMHAERFIVDKKTIERMLHKKGRTIAVGTTSVRTLESLYWLGVKRINEKSSTVLEQWDAEKLAQNISVDHALTELLKEERNFIEGSTSLMIVPGYRFRMIDGLITNFHQPCSTLLLLVASFVGYHHMKQIYQYALDNEFRFLSYGDSSILFPNHIIDNIECK